MRQGKRGFPEESRLPMIWGDEVDHDLLAYYQDLAAVRKANRPLRKGKRQTVIAQDQALAYSQSLEREQLVTVLNLSLEKTRVNLPAVLDKKIISTDRENQLHLEEGNTVAELLPLSGLLFSSQE